MGTGQYTRRVTYAQRDTFRRRVIFFKKGHFCMRVENNNKIIKLKKKKKKKKI